MSKPKLFTIGHSNREIEEFIHLLQENNITAVADVRSSPYSRQFPQFNSDCLKHSLNQSQIEYVFLGEELGARRSEGDCYVDGVAVYDRISGTAAFKEGLGRIRRGSESHQIAMMCAEKDPLTCHRTILVCRHLKDDFEIFHIIDASQVEDHHTAEIRLLDLVDLPKQHLFQSEAELIEDAYEKQGKKIAYRIGASDISTATHSE